MTVLLPSVSVELFSCGRLYLQEKTRGMCAKFIVQVQNNRNRWFSCNPLLVCISFHVLIFGSFLSSMNVYTNCFNLANSEGYLPSWRILNIFPFSKEENIWILLSSGKVLAAQRQVLLFAQRSLPPSVTFLTSAPLSNYISISQDSFNIIQTSIKFFDHIQWLKLWPFQWFSAHGCKHFFSFHFLKANIIFWKCDLWF